MRAHHLWRWLLEANRMETPDSTNCMKVFDLVHTAFREGLLAEEEA